MNNIYECKKNLNEKMNDEYKGSINNFIFLELQYLSLLYEEE